MPPWERVELIEKGRGLDAGTRVVMRVRVGPIWRRWVAEHRACEPGESFRDVQVEGPFRRWEHDHLFHATGPGECELEDRVLYELPLGPLGRLFGGGLARRSLERMFRYRHAITAGDLAAHGGSSETAPMKILVSGSSGLVGSALLPFLTTGGHRVTRLLRRAPEGDADARCWDPTADHLEPDVVAGHDAVVHLGGAGIADARWTDDRKELIRDSRVQSTRVLAETLAKLPNPPRVLVAASAIGFYGDRGEELIDEESPPGTGFLPEVCQEWESAAEPARQAGIRVVHLRLGVILTPRGGALKRMLTPFKIGLGGRLGSGAQYMSWIGIDDVLGAIHHALVTESLDGPLNAVAGAVTNSAFTEALGRALSRPTWFPVPAFAARLAFGEMADPLLLASTRVEPGRLRAAGYAFRHADLESALRHVLGR
jgi:uncharacterized protein (TIGR01777 family)